MASNLIPFHPGGRFYFPVAFVLQVEELDDRSLVEALPLRAPSGVVVSIHRVTWRAYGQVGKAIAIEVSRR